MRGLRGTMQAFYLTAPGARAALAVWGLTLFPAALASQQRADPDFRPRLGAPAFERGAGPTVAIDEGHRNWHTASGRFAPFAELIALDGYVVHSIEEPFTVENLQDVDMLVIANAAADTLSDESERLPTAAAFTAEEIEALRKWVELGGSLLLIADHMPSGGEARTLAAAFGILFSNGFTYSGRRNPLPDVFSRAQGLLRDHPIVRGRSPEEAIDSVATFRGQAFQATSDVQPIMVYGSAAYTLLPADAAADFDEKTPRIPSPGWYHGVTLIVGDGRVAVFGEAAMFTAQVFGEQRRKLGMNHPAAAQNAQFVINVMRWLSGLSND